MRIRLCGAALAVLVACNGEEGQTPGPAESTAGMIGGGGGTLTFDGGQLTIPAGALEQDVMIEVTRAEGAGETFTRGDHVVLTPSGLTFSTPATLTLVTDATLEEGEEFTLYKWVDRDPFVEDDELISLHRGTYDSATGAVSAEIAGFSRWGIAVACGQQSTSSRCSQGSNGSGRGIGAVAVPFPSVPRPVIFDVDWDFCRREFEVAIPRAAPRPWVEGFPDPEIWVVRSYETPNGFQQDLIFKVELTEPTLVPGRVEPAPDEPPIRYKFDAYAKYADWFNRRLVNPPASQTLFGFESVDPAVPAEVTVAATSATENLLQWKEGELPASVSPPLIERYEITRSPPWPTDPVRTVDADDTVLVEEDGRFVDVYQFTDDSASGTTHYYVRAVNIVNCPDPEFSAWSVLWVNGMPAPPSAPQNLRANESPGRVALRWDDVLGASFYRVYIGSSAVPFTLVAETAREFSSFTDEYASAGEVSYRVTAVNDVGESDFAEVTVNVRQASPGPTPGASSTLEILGTLSLYVDPPPSGAPAGTGRVYCIPDGTGESGEGTSCARDGVPVDHPLVYPAGTVVTVEPTSAANPLWRADRDCARLPRSNAATVTVDGERECAARAPLPNSGFQLRLDIAPSNCAEPLTVEVYEEFRDLLAATCTGSSGSRCQYAVGDDTAFALERSVLRIVAPNGTGIALDNGRTDTPPSGDAFIDFIDCPAETVNGNEATINLVENFPAGAFTNQYMTTCEVTLTCP